MNRTDFSVNPKHVKLRTAAFLLALAIAVAAFTYAITGLGRKSAGIYEISASRDEEAPFYQSGVTFHYSFEGSSGAIKALTNEVSAAYGASLKSAYILLDSENVYDNRVNIATLNRSIGQDVQVTPELFDILTDACAKTQENVGYNVFAGALYKEWNSILILLDPDDFDPTVNRDEAERIAALAEATNDLDNFSLEIVDRASCTLRLDVSQSYLDLLTELEIDPVILDLNLLRDAYKLSLLAADLEAGGYGDGYLVTDSGLFLSLSGFTGGEFCFNSSFAGAPLPAALSPIHPSMAASQFRVFPYEEDEPYYYAIAEGEHTHYRHPYLPASGTYPDVLTASVCISPTGDLIDACYENIRLGALTGADAVAALAASDGDFLIGYTLQADTEKIVYANAQALTVLTPADYGYQLQGLS